MKKGFLKLRPAEERSPFWWFRWVPTVVLSVLVLYFLYVVGSVVIVPVLASVALAYLLNPIVVRFQMWGLSRVTASLVAIVVVSLAIWPAAGLISSGYTTDAATIAIAAPALVLACLFFAPDALQVVIAQALRARGDVWMPTYTHLASYILVMMPLAWWLAIPLGLGVNGIVWGVTIASVLSFALLLGRFWILSRRGL